MQNTCATVLDWLTKKGKGVHSLILDATFVCIHTVPTELCIIPLLFMAAMVYDLQVVVLQRLATTV